MRHLPSMRYGTSPIPGQTSIRCSCISTTSTSTANRLSNRLILSWRCSFSAIASAEQKARNFAYYEPLTVRDSSLSAAPQAVLAAEVGQLDLAYDYLGEAALMDLEDLEHNTRDGLHIASLAGSWMALVSGFGGLRWQDGALSFTPRLPESIQRLAFHILFKGSRLRVEVKPHEATYRLLGGPPLKMWHHGEEIHLSGDQPVTRHIHGVKAGPRPSQPPGRAPLPRGERQQS